MTTTLPWLVLAAGIGLPELAHLEVGTFVAPRVDVHLRFTAPLLQPALGAGARVYVGPLVDERPPRWAFTGALDVTVNPFEPTFYEGGEKVGTVAYPLAGGAYLGDRGFVARLEAGAILGVERRSEGARVAGGPDVRIAFGWSWGPRPAP